MEKQNGRLWTGSCRSGWCPVEGCFERGNEPSDSIKGGEFLA